MLRSGKACGPNEAKGSIATQAQYPTGTGDDMVCVAGFVQQQQGTLLQVVPCHHDYIIDC